MNNYNMNGIRNANLIKSRIGWTVVLVLAALDNARKGILYPTMYNRRGK